MPRLPLRKSICKKAALASAEARRRRAATLAPPVEPQHDPQAADPLPLPPDPLGLAIPYASLDDLPIISSGSDTSYSESSDPCESDFFSDDLSTGSAEGDLVDSGEFFDEASISSGPDEGEQESQQKSVLPLDSSPHPEGTATPSQVSTECSGSGLTQGTVSQPDLAMDLPPDLLQLGDTGQIDDRANNGTRDLVKRKVWDTEPDALCKKPRSNDLAESPQAGEAKTSNQVHEEKSCKPAHEVKSSNLADEAKSSKPAHEVKSSNQVHEEKSCKPAHEVKSSNLADESMSSKHEVHGDIRKLAVDVIFQRQLLAYDDHLNDSVHCRDCTRCSQRHPHSSFPQGSKVCSKCRRRGKKIWTDPHDITCYLELKTVLGFGFLVYHRLPIERKAEA